LVRAVGLRVTSPVLVMMAAALSGSASAACWMNALAACSATTSAVRAVLRVATEPLARDFTAVSAVSSAAWALVSSAMIPAALGRCTLPVKAAMNAAVNLRSIGTGPGSAITARMRTMTVDMTLLHWVETLR
jgi:hypothetical protein